MTHTYFSLKPADIDGWTPKSTQRHVHMYTLIKEKMPEKAHISIKFLSTVAENVENNV